MTSTKRFLWSLCLSAVLPAVVLAAASDASVSDAGVSAVADAGVKVEEGTPDDDAPTRPALRIDRMPFSQDSIREVVAYHQEEIQACYEKTLADKNKVMDGKLNTSFLITKDGEVKDARVLKRGTTLREPKLHDCVIERLTAMRFPKPHDKREHPVEYPFNLKTVR